MFNRPQKPKKEVESVFSLINIIFLLIVFFLVAGHIAAEQFKVSPPLLDQGEVLSKKNCTIYVKKEGLYYQDILLKISNTNLANLSHRCNGEILLAAQNQAEALLVVNALSQLKSHFSNIKLLVAQR